MMPGIVCVTKANRLRWLKHMSRLPMCKVVKAEMQGRVVTERKRGRSVDGSMKLRRIFV